MDPTGSDSSLPPPPDPVARPQVVYHPRRSTRRRRADIQTALRKEAERRQAERASKRLQVAQSSDNPHPLVAATQQSLALARPDALGMVHSGRGCLSITATPRLVERSMLLLDALIKAMEAKGWSMRVDPARSPATRVVVGEEQFGLTLEELIESHQHIPTEDEKRQQKADPVFFSMPKRDRVPSGRLNLAVTPCYAGRGHWSDTTRYMLEDCLDLCIGAIEQSAAQAPAIRERQAQARIGRERAEQERLQQEQRRRQEQLRQAALKEQQERCAQLLVGHIERMRLADLIREYGRRLEEAARIAGADLGPDSTRGRWLAWVQEHARRLDPCRPEVLDTDPDLARALGEPRDAL